MIKINLDDLKIESPLPHDIYHESARRLHAAGDILLPKHKQLLIECGIQWVYGAEDGENEDILRNKLVHASLSIDELPIDIESPVNLLDEDNNILIAENQIVTPAIKEKILDKGIKKIFYDRDAAQLNAFQLDKYRALIEGAVDKVEFNSQAQEMIEENVEVTEKTAEDEKDENKQKNFQSKITSLINNPQEKLSMSQFSLDILKGKHQLSIILGEGKAFKEIVKTAPKAPRTLEEKTNMWNQYKGWLGTLNELMDRFKAGRDVTHNYIERLAQTILLTFQNDPAYYFNLSNFKVKKDHQLYLSVHSLNVALISTKIGCHLNYTILNMLELVYGALLHDVGLLKIPKRIFLSTDRLPVADQIEYEKHTSHAINCLRMMDRVPVSTPFAVFQAHECNDGTGYPKKFQGKLIHDYAKVIHLADEYESLLSNISYNFPITPRKALVALLKMTKSGKIDQKVFNAMLMGVAIFPIGTVVMLSNGNIAKVVSANTKDPLSPTVCQLFAKQNNKFVSLKTPQFTDLAETQSLKIQKDIFNQKLLCTVSEGF